MSFPLNKHLYQGFTLLELLVVIGIIGILAGVVWVSYRGHTEKARLSNTMQWAKSIHSLVGVYAVGGWSFDNITGDTVLDDSGNGNNGTRYGALQVDGVMGKALSFDGVDDSVNITSNLGSPSAMTISLWFKKPDINAGPQYFIDSRNSGNFYFLQDYKGSLTDSNGNINFDDRLEILSSRLSNNTWYNVVVTENVTEAKIYLNGQLVATGAGETPVIGSTLRIGHYNTNNSYTFNGFIDDVRIYEEAFTQAQIQQLYAEGLKTHQSLAKIETPEKAP